MIHNDGIRILVKKDEKTDNYILVVYKNKPKFKVLEYFEMSTIYELYQTNFLLKKKYDLHDYLFSYAQHLEGKPEAGWQFLDAVTDYIIYKE